MWVDDHPEGNAAEIEAAKKDKIEIVQVKSTKEAMKWLSARKQELSGKSPSGFRVVTDLHVRFSAPTPILLTPCFLQRDDEGDVAGKNLISALRGDGWSETPILCYTGENISALDVRASDSSTW